MDINNISSLTCGIRYEKTFRITDIAGSIFDTILHSKSSPFSSDFFPRYQELNSQDRALINFDRGYYFRVTTSDIIFKYTIFHDKTEVADEIDWFKNDAIQFIIKEIIAKNNIQNIIRFGFMISHTVDGENLGGNVLDHLSSGDIKKADQFTLRFGNKDTTADGLIKKGIDDYVNRISTIKQIKENQYEATYDYQYYFIPNFINLKDWNVNSFFDKSILNLNNKFYYLIKSLLNSMVEVK